MEQHFMTPPILPELINGEILLSFDGEATKDHTIDLKLYAQSLQGFYNAFAKVNKDLLHFDIEIEIIGEIEGSVVAKIKYVGKIVAKGIAGYSIVASALSFHGIQFEDVKNYAYNAFASTIECIKYYQGNVADFEKIELDTEDKDMQHYLALLKNSEYRMALDDMTFFLESDGMEEMKISSGTASVTISATDRPYFKALLEDNKIEEECEDTVKIVSISRTHLWRFHSLKIAKEFNAQIIDEDFFNKIQLFPVEKIFDMSFEATILKTIITRAGKKKADSPTYTIDKFKIIPKQADFSSIASTV